MLRSSHSGVRRTFLSYSDCFGDYAYGLLPLFQVALYSVLALLNGLSLSDCCSDTRLDLALAGMMAGRTPLSLPCALSAIA